jgi:hypothetical protein
VQRKVTPALVALMVTVGALAGCSATDTIAPAPATTTTTSRTPSATASIDASDPAVRARQALATITAAAAADAIGSVVVRPAGVEAMIVKGAAAERWSLVNGAPVLGLAVARSTEAASLPAASFPLDAVAQLRSAMTECPSDYEIRVQLLPSRQAIAALDCVGGENRTVVAQVLGGVRLGAVRDRYSPESLAEFFREASVIAPGGRVLSIELAGAKGERAVNVAFALPAYDAGGYRCAPSTWTRPLAAGDQGLLVPVPCAATTVAPTTGLLLAPSTLDPASVVSALEAAKAQLGSDLSGASSVRLTMTASGAVLQADDTTGAAPGSAYVRLV